MTGKIWGEKRVIGQISKVVGILSVCPICKKLRVIMDGYAKPFYFRSGAVSLTEEEINSIPPKNCCQ